MSGGEPTPERTEYLEALHALVARMAEHGAGRRQGFWKALDEANERHRRLPDGWSARHPGRAIQEAMGHAMPTDRLIDVVLSLIYEERGRPCRCSGLELVRALDPYDGYLTFLDARRVAALVRKGKLDDPMMDGRG